MSFSKDIKNEILSNQIISDEYGLAFLSGLFSSSAQIEINNEISFMLATDLQILPDFINSITKKLYGDLFEVEICKGYQIKKQNYYKLIFNQNSYNLLLDTGCLKLENGTMTRNMAIDEYMIKEQESLKYFVQGVFVGCGTSSIKINQQDRLSTGYHLEFASHNYEFLSGLSHILAQFDISAKLVKRKNLYILYVKDANEVSNVLALMGAYNAVLSLQNEMALREVRNKVNRQTNCMNANINKMVEASIKQNDAISIIIKEIGLEELPQDLQNVALLRMANPEESLEELVKLASFPITKSGLNYRLNKLVKLADKFKE